MGLVFWLVLALVVAGVAVIRGRSQARRRASLIRFTDALGLQYAATDIFDDRWEPFRLFGLGRDRGIRNVVYGRFEGQEVRAFDYWYREGADRETGSALAFAGWLGLAAWIGLTRRFSCAVAGLPSSCPSLVVEPKGLRDRVVELVAPDVPLESERFVRRFRVRCEDPRFAIAFLDPRVMEALLAVPKPPTLALSEDRMLLVSRRLSPGGVIELLHCVSALAGRVPRVLASLYPLRPGFRPEDGVAAGPWQQGL